MTLAHRKRTPECPVSISHFSTAYSPHSFRVRGIRRVRYSVAGNLGWFVRSFNRPVRRNARRDFIARRVVASCGWRAALSAFPIGPPIKVLGSVVTILTIDAWP